MLAVTKRNVARLRDLIEDLLTLSKAESQGTELERIDLRTLVREVAGDLRFSAASRDIRLEVDQPGEPMLVLADRSQLHRALLNVATNAVKFSDNGAEVVLRTSLAGDAALLEVVDTGMGIPAGDLPGIGNRFFRASNAVAGQIAGTGLGLRIVQTILDNHDGSMQVSSVEGAGTTVRIRVPLQQESRVPLPE